jgi:hypothetical protein
VRVLPSLLSLFVIPGCFLDYTVGEPGKPDRPGKNERIDRDGDGFTEDEGDCNDSSALQAPGLLEDCDTLDNDCNGIVDWGESERDPCSESVWQRQTLRADVLVVMDVSENMREYASLAAAGAVEMLKHLVGKGRDAHVGVITSDMEREDAKGKLVEKQFGDGGVRRFVKGSDDFYDASLWLTFAVADHTPLEAGKEGMRDAIAGSIVDHTDGWNSGFFRADANLSIILITNDEDSSDLGNAEIDALLDLYKSSGTTPARIHGIIQQDQHCGGMSTSESLSQLIDATMGLQSDICMSDYEGFMSSVGQVIADEALHDQVTLKSPAVPDTVRVHIQEDGADNPYVWVGDIAISTDGLTVYFVDTIPPAGTTIIIEYRKVPTPPAVY